MFPPSGLGFSAKQERRRLTGVGDERFALSLRRKSDTDIGLRVALIFPWQHDGDGGFRVVIGIGQCRHLYRYGLPGREVEMTGSIHG